MINNNNKIETVNSPQDISIPFFAYGIFKPGQLAYSKIKNHVKEIINVEIKYQMLIRDGVPIIMDGESNYHRTNGFIISFKEGHEKDSYHIIGKTILKSLYQWKSIKINGKKVNILFGVNPNYGSNTIDDPIERVNFDGKNDPLFSEAIKLIEKNLNSDNNSRNIENFFTLQMNYMLLWSAIDRYSSIKFNKTSAVNNNKLSNQKSFKDAIMKFKDEYHMPVYSTDDLKVHTFNADDSYETLKYYYTFRCNVVHRGKAMISDYSMLKQATEELLEIFKDVLRDTFYEI